MGVVYGTPRVARDAVPRPAVARALDEAEPITVIHGPAGAGKTVAVASWSMARAGLNHSDATIEGVWFTVGPSASNRATIWHELAHLLVDARLLPLASPLHSTLPLFDASGESRRLVARAIGQLDELIVVVDGVDRIKDAAVVSELLDLVEATPALRLILISRAVAPFDSVAVNLRFEPRLVGPQALLFDEQDVEILLRKSSLIDESQTGSNSELIRSIMAATFGLPVAVRGAIFALTHPGSITTDLINGDSINGDSSLSLEQRIAALGPSLVDALVGGLNGRDMEAALRASVSEVLTVELTERLTGHPDPAELLRKAEEGGVGMWSHGLDGPVFHWTAVSRAALREELKRRHPRELRRLEHVVAVWAAEHGRPYLAFRTALASGDYDLASTIALHDWIGLLNLHRDELSELILTVPVRVLRHHPELSMLLALADNSSPARRGRAADMFALAASSARARRHGAKPADAAMLHAIESAALRVTGQVDRAADSAQVLTEAIDSLPEDEYLRLGPMRPMIEVHAGLSMFYADRPQEAIALHQRAYSSSRLEAPHAWFMALGNLAGINAARGELPEAAELVEFGRTLDWPRGWMSGYVGSMFQLAEGYLALDRLDYQAVADLVKLIPIEKSFEHWPLFAHLDAMAELGLGNAAGAAVRMDDTLSFGTSAAVNAFTRSRLGATRVLLLLASGRVRAADALLRTLERTQAPVALAWSRLELAEGRPDAALASLVPIEGRPLSSRLLVELRLSRAAAALRLGRDPQAIDDLRAATSLMADRGLRHSLTLLAASDRAAFARLAANHGLDEASRVVREVDGFGAQWPDGTGRPELTERERVVLRQLHYGAGATEISAALFVSVNTVKSQLRSVYRKLGVSSREDALRAAAEHGLLD
jgi:LuxR family maltose regulon positive regulatory protein